MPSKIFVYFISFLLVSVCSLVLFKKYKLNKEQKMIFLFVMLFWSATVLVRAYRKSYAFLEIEAGGLALGGIAAANIASAYGLSSLFGRFSIYALSDFLRSKKMLIGSALVLLVLSNASVLVFPGYVSLYLNSFMLGVCASFLSMFNLLFAQTFEEKAAMKSVSLLSLAPLMAEFGMSTFQSHFTKKTEANYPALWFLSMCMALLALVFLIFFKEKRQSEARMKWSFFKERVTNQEVWLFGVLGILVSFIKFSTSGSNLITYFQSDFIAMNHWFVAYSDFLFAMAQLVGGILAGLYFHERLGLRKTLSLGIFVGLLFQILLVQTRQPYLLFFACALSGFGYGLVYNSLIGLALSKVSVQLREMNMAIYQSFFSVGIFYGDKIYAEIWKWFAPLTVLQKYQYVYLIALFLSVVALGLLLLVKEQKSKALSLKEAAKESLKEV